MNPSHLLALATLMTPRFGERPIERFELRSPSTEGARCSARLERSQIEQVAEHEAATVEEAIGLALQSLALGAAVRGRPPQALQQLVEWLEQAPQRSLEVVADDKSDVATHWDPQADEDDDIWLTAVRLRAPGTDMLEAHAPTLEDACKAALSSPAWKKLRDAR